MYRVVSPRRGSCIEAFRPDAAHESSRFAQTRLNRYCNLLPRSRTIDIHRNRVFFRC
jgi:hypothetical protein